MTTTDATADGGSSQDPIITMNQPALRCAQWAMLDELSTMLEMTKQEVDELRDSRKAFLEEGYDARAHIGYVLNTVEALDCLGWRHAIQTDEDLAKIAQEDAEKRRKADQEDES